MAIRHFHDLVLVADDVRRNNGDGPVEGFTVHVFDSPVGQGEKKEQVTVLELAQSLRFLENRTLDNKVEKQIELGQTLADLLLPPYARKLFRESLMRIRDDEGLRLRLRLDDALADFPWEYMYIQDTRGEKVSSSFLALDPQISIVRHEALALPTDWFDIPGDFYEAPARRRVVVAMATPPSYPPLSSLPAEQKAIRQALETVPGIEATYVPEYTADHYDLVPSATLEDIFSALRQRADIFHFSGHGEFASDLGPALGSKVGAGGIVLASATGEALPVAADRFAEVLRGKGVRLVVLGGCETARRDGRHVWSGVAAALLRVGIPAVVAMQFKIRDDLAAVFSGTMYEALVEGREVDEAVGLGRAAMRIKAMENNGPDLRDWGVPVLYLRSPHGVVFRPVQDECALQKAAASLERVIEHQKQEPSIQVKQQVKKIGKTGRVVGAEIGEVKSESVFVDQKVSESVDGVLLGADVVRIQGGKVEVVQKADTVSGELIGLKIGQISGDSITVGDVGGVAAIGKGAQAFVQHDSLQEIESFFMLRPVASSPGGSPPSATMMRTGGSWKSCPNCGTSVPEGAKFCANCGLRQSTACKACGHEAPSEAKFCSNCGAPFS
jgi:CHAT domain/Double zinc ribbon